MKGPALKRDVDWGHLAFLTVIAGIVLWYLQDAIFVSLAANNLLLVLPLGLVVLAFCAVVVPQCLKKEDPNRKVKSHMIKELSADDLRTGDRKKLAVIVGMAGSLGAYVVLLNIIGFDVATVLFAAVAMFICGERRPLHLAIYSLLVGGVLVWAFRALLPFPMYTTIL